MLRKISNLCLIFAVVLTIGALFWNVAGAGDYEIRDLGQEIVISSSTDEHNVRNISMASDDAGDIYVVWDELYTTNREIHISYSHDEGSTWSSTNEDRVISYPNGNNATHPNIFTNGSYVYAVWQEIYEGKWQIMFGLSTDGGSSWSSSQQDNLVTNPENTEMRDCIDPKIAVDSTGEIHAVWLGYNTTLKQWEVYYEYSKDDGNTWSKYTLISDSSITGDVKSLDMTITDKDEIYVFWTKPKSGSYEVYVSVSKDQGVTWSMDTVSYPDGHNATNVSSSSGGGTVVVIWEELNEKSGTMEIFHSTYDGSSWSGATNDDIISYPDGNNASSPSLSYSSYDKIYHAVWSEFDDSTGRMQVHYSNSTDGGFKWSSSSNGKDYVLTNSQYDDYEPKISCGPKGDFYAAWREWTPLQTKQKGSDEVHFMSVSGNINIPELSSLLITLPVAVVAYGIHRKRK